MAKASSDVAILLISGNTTKKLLSIEINNKYLHNNLFAWARPCAQVGGFKGCTIIIIKYVFSKQPSKSRTSP